MNKKWWLTSLLLAFSTIELISRDTLQEVEMADQFRSDGKIYVVVAVILVLILGLSFFVFRMDRKISNLEKRVKEKSE